jgi:nucleoside-diphosphate-sugar epimerase
MKVLVLGATGATGSLVVKQLVDRNINMKIVVRKIESVSEDILNNKSVETIIGSISEFESSRFKDLISDCDAVISCLGHNISLAGIYGKPRMLVTDCIKNVCEAAESKKGKLKLILMSTTANRNKTVNELYAPADRIVLSLLTYILPPHKDNIEAAKYLSYTIADKNKNLEWTVVRPDSLINKEEVSRYEISASPRQSPIFSPGKTSRINVSHFMTELLLNEEHWDEWKYKMPVIYNAE